MSDHFDWGPPGDGDEDEPEETQGEGESPGGWPEEKPGYGSRSASGWADDEPEQGRHAPSDWPTTSPWQHPDHSDYGAYGYGRPEAPPRDEEAERYAARRTRDPLARLFPGLPRGVRVALDWVLTIAGAILIVLALKQWVVNPYRIPSSSMEPTLNCAKPALGCLGNSSDRVLACRICLHFESPARNDIVVFNTPSEAALKCGEGGTFVKRVIGLPGETVHEDRKGYIWIRAPGATRYVRLNEPFVSAKDRLADSEHFGEYWPTVHGRPTRIPPGNYFMMGDNRSQSCDSRTWGTVPRSKLIGIVFFVYWPPDRIGFR
ncbi:MAG TPA: signal peptidase I [Gaiellaceae bacterium]|nr:signal peptidase I [Gaiellaceae bacterium]